jgi:sporulation protein YunB
MRFRVRLKKRFFVFLFLMVIIIIYFLLDNAIRPTVLSLAEARLRSIAVKSMNNAVRETIADLNYKDFISVTIDDNNNVSFIQADTIKMNDVATKTALKAQENISSAGEQGVSIPLGTLIGGQLLTGQGPRIKVKMQPIGSVTSEYKTEFEDAGINQTRHKIFIILLSDVRIVIGNRGNTVSVSTQILVSETIIIGGVPDSFMKFDNEDDLLNLLPIQ